jgi:hypothetical protein
VQEVPSISVDSVSYSNSMAHGGKMNGAINAVSRGDKSHLLLDVFLGSPSQGTGRVLSLSWPHHTTV